MARSRAETIPSVLTIPDPLLHCAMHALLGPTGSRKVPVMPRALGGKLQVGGGLFGAFTERNFLIKTSDCTLKYYKAGESSGTPLGSFDLRQVGAVAVVMAVT
jgi:hypothetical protein